MAPARDAHRYGRGGEIVQTLRTARPHALAASAALTVGAALAAYPLARAGTLLPLAAALGALALVALGYALARDARLLLLSLALLTVDYTVIDLVHTQPLLVAPFFGTGLLLTGELTYAANALRRARLIAVAGTALTSSFVVALAGSAAVPGGFGAALLALAAAGGLLAAPLLLLRRVSLSPAAAQPSDEQPRKLP